ncbi:MAG TPA: CBS domain-containing protein [Holophaga sp.]|nr:CBS domain-containing protein [Holophaga sp.]HPS68795.1 CBS domain-containing protein [Holophaga sp.]
MSNIQTILNRKANCFWFIEPEATVQQAVRRLHEKKIGALLVMDDERLVGIFSERDLVRLVAAQGAKCLERTVGEVMTRKVLGVKPETTVDECMALMSEKGFRHVPVLDGKKVLGVVSNRDVVYEAIADRESLLSGMDVLIANHEFPT